MINFISVKLHMKKSLWILCLCACHIAMLTAQQNPCDGRLMVNGTHGDSSIYPLLIDRANQSCQVGEPVVTVASPAEIWDADATGYSWKSQQFYGAIIYNSATRIDLFTIGQDGNFEVTFVTSPDLEDGFFLYSGCVSNDQQHLLLIENMNIPMTIIRDPTRPNNLHKVNLESGNYEVETILLHGIAASDTVGIFSTDVAVDPVSSLAYTFDLYTERLMAIDLNSGEVDNLSFPRINASEYDNYKPTTMFFDAFGRLYGMSADRDGGYLFEYDKHTGTILQAYDFIAPNDKMEVLDGCSCPFTIALEKELKAENLRQCQTIEAVIDISVLNEALLQPAVFKDSFPPGVEILEVVYNPYGGSVSGIGTHILEIEDMPLKYGIDSIIVRIFIPEDMAAGSYACQASINGLDLSELGDSRTSVFSDYRPTPAFRDATPFSVTALGELSPRLYFEICEEEPGAIRPFEDSFGMGFLWEGGSTADSLVVSSPGQYGLTIDTGCDTFHYTVEAAQNELYLSLGPDVSLLFGETTTLTPAVQSSSPVLSYSWSANDSTALSCQDCTFVEVTPSENPTTVSLQVINESGCVEEDEIRIQVERPAYVPTAFSPNGDGKNDIMLIYTPAEIQIEYFQVYGRWGELLWETKNGVTISEKYGWDGTSGKEAVPPGVYTWSAKLQYADGKTQQIKGEVNLIR